MNLKRLRSMLALLLMSSILMDGAIAQETAVTELPFGLSNFHWQMTSAEVSARLDSLAPREPKPARASRDTSDIFVGPSAWKNCRFDVGFSFVSNSLVYIHLYPRGDNAACQSDVQNELAAHFGQAPRDSFESVSGAQTAAYYAQGGIFLSKAERVLIHTDH